mmetsp:Transcript_10904/g.11976  ORF Transcript_10904/g.11976 Transcript_10904/m.11976 type:complete len:145 (-) Transcript_10904:93-527(-)|eukprot:CAMPEP_0168530574 /NCGR_PEP_ID=MMETSP0405-20121227/14772_1 /TAXON_ID=498012 /ORGANISM="Trichosphaerium sp, Strain Am-I-7 wt" /LENGTH=144 /DNA_ID=CAMNT_0008554889 /DNA_START=28 /DNA_END=462 /DNA_ORIENTATION=-
MEQHKKRVQTFGRKKTALAVAFLSEGTGVIKVNGKPWDLIEPKVLAWKIYEPIALVGADKFTNLDIRVRVRGGGKVAQIYAIRQAMARGAVAWYQKYVDEASKRELKEIYTGYDRFLLVADPRQKEAKKFGGHGARARKRKSYR